MANSADLLEKICDLHKEAESVMSTVTAGSVESDPALAQLEGIEKEIERVEKVLYTMGQSEDFDEASVCVSNDLQYFNRLERLFTCLKRDLSASVEIGGFPAQKLIDSLLQLVSRPEEPQVRIGLIDLLRLASVAERPDFSPIQLLRKCRFEAHENTPTAAYNLYNVLIVAERLSAREGMSVCTVGTDRNEPVSFLVDGNKIESTVAPPVQGERIAVMLICMGLCNKVEQLFSPTSVVCQMAKSAQGIARCLLRGSQVITCMTADVSWLGLVYPSLLVRLSASDTLQEILRIVKSERTEAGYAFMTSEFVLSETEAEHSTFSPQTTVALLLVVRGIAPVPGTKSIILSDRHISIQGGDIQSFQHSTTYRAASLISSVETKNSEVKISLYCIFKAFFFCVSRMEWPGDAVVPSYVSHGQSFEDMLVAYKAFTRRGAPEPMRDDDEDMRTTKGRKKMGIQRKVGGIGKTKHGKQDQVVIGKKGKGALKKGAGAYESKRPSGGVSVSVKNIPYAVSDGELRNHFSHLGRIMSARIERESNGKSRGSGIVTFNTRKEALTVVESMQNTRLGDRPIRVTIVESMDDVE